MKNLKILRKQKINNKCYAVVFKVKNATHSYFGLDANDLEFVKNILDKLKLRYDVYFIDNRNSVKDYGVELDTIDILLHDFINFVCDYKGHKIGVGDFFVSKFISERCK